MVGVEVGGWKEGVNGEELKVLFVEEACSDVQPLGSCRVDGGGFAVNLVGGEVLSSSSSCQSRVYYQHYIKLQSTSAFA